MRTFSQCFYERLRISTPICPLILLSRPQCGRCNLPTATVASELFAATVASELFATKKTIRYCLCSTAGRPVRQEGRQSCAWSAGRVPPARAGLQALRQGLTEVHELREPVTRQGKYLVEGAGPRRRWPVDITTVPSGTRWRATHTW